MPGEALRGRIQASSQNCGYSAESQLCLDATLDPIQACWGVKIPQCLVY